MILLIDNFDSFVNNLARYFRELGHDTKIFRCNNINLTQIEALKPTHIVLSPGPCTPYEAGICLPLIQHFAGIIPILGICLGHQAIACAFGGKLLRAEQPIHGKSDLLHHQGGGALRGIQSPLQIARYHSLVVDPVSLPPCLIVDAVAKNGEIMAFHHIDYPLIGLQFHPESILTHEGHKILNNFLE